jgi:hypothetical protein
MTARLTFDENPTKALNFISPSSSVSILNAVQDKQAGLAIDTAFFLEDAGIRNPAVH